VEKRHPSAPSLFSVDPITQQRMPGVGKMDPELMRSTGARTKPQQAEGGPRRCAGEHEPLLYAPLGHGFTRSLGKMNAGHFFSIRTMASDGPVDDSSVRHYLAPSKSHIFLVDGAVFKLQHQALVCQHILRSNHHTRSVFVQPVHDTRPAHPADSLKIRTMMQQGVDQSSTPMTRSRMNRDSGALFTTMQSASS